MFFSTFEMPPKKRKSYVDERCASCNTLLRHDTGLQKVILTNDEAQTFSVCLGVQMNIGDISCHKCRSKAYKMKTKLDQPSTSRSHSSQEVASANLLTEMDLDEPDYPRPQPVSPEPENIPSEADPMERQSSRLSNLSESGNEPQSAHPPCLAQQAVTQSSSSLSSQSVTRSSSSLSSQSQSSSSSDPTFVAREKKQSEPIIIPFKRVTASHKHCCVCLVQDRNFVVVPFRARLQAFINSRIFIPKNNRCCSEHLIGERFYADEIPKLQVFANTCKIDSDELENFLNVLSDSCNNSILDRLEDNNLSDERIKSLTGYDIEQISTLKKMLISMRNSGNRSVNQALFVFLFILRTGNSNSIAASIFDIKYDQQVSDYCDSVLKAFNKDVLPNHFGVQACSREDLIANHTSPYVKKLHGFENRLVLIADGSYVQHEKSSNNCYQRKSYSGQKNVPLFKPFTVCTTDGFVVDVFGPYEATVNDATIMMEIFKDPSGLRSLLQKGDVFILDRGFRDVKNFLQSEGFVVLMPALKGKRKQLTTQEANDSRFVTKLRWVVEAVHGIIGSKFQLLHHEFDNKRLLSAKTYCKIANFLVNLFGKRLNCDSELQDEITNEMLLRKNVNNDLAKVVEEKNWNRKKRIFRPLTSNDVVDFPELTERDLKILFTGSYQLSQTVSYLAELCTEDGVLNMHYLLEDKSILKCEVQSRHISRKKYRCYVKYVPNAIGRSGIEEYVCDCANGLRTVGCCAHVATIIYFLGHARYLSRIIRPAQILTNLFSVQSVEPVIEGDSDED